MILKNKKLIATMIISFAVSSCVRLYNGSFAQPDFKLIQPDELGPTVEKWEDGARTKGNHNEFEWWYLDAKLEDGSLFVCYFYKVLLTGILNKILAGIYIFFYIIANIFKLLGRGTVYKIYRPKYPSVIHILMIYNLRI